MWVAHLDGQGDCLYLECFDGDEGSAPVPITTILADIVTYGSKGLVLAHNHPSGDVRPSDPDRRITRRLAMLTEAIDCPVLDHLIFGGGAEWTSFRELGLL
jgi:DNA repair protein RadC